MTGMNYEYEDSQASEDKRQSTTPRPYTRLGCYNSGNVSALWQAWYGSRVITQRMKAYYDTLGASEQELFSQDHMNLHALLSLLPDKVYTAADLEERRSPGARTAAPSPCS